MEKKTKSFRLSYMHAVKYRVVQKKLTISSWASWGPKKKYFLNIFYFV